MAKINANYEAVYILNPSLSEEKTRKALGQFLRPEFLGRVDEVIAFKPLSQQTLEGIAALMEKFKAIVEAEGTLTGIEEWGKRRLAYPINDLMEGYYVLMTFNAAAAIPAELDRIFRITDGVMRSLIVCKDQ